MKVESRTFGAGPLDITRKRRQYYLRHVHRIARCRRTICDVGQRLQGDLLESEWSFDFIAQQISTARAVQVASELGLQESEERHKEMLQNLPIGIYRHTPAPEGRFIMANTTMAQMLGYESTEEFLKQPGIDIYHNTDEFAELMSKLATKGNVVAKEMRLRKADGSHFWAAITARAVRKDTGKLLYFDGAVEDVTRRKLAETDGGNTKMVNEKITRTYTESCYLTR